MEHVRYPKIPTALDKQSQEQFKKIIKNGSSRWCVTEKIHGANFSIYINRNNEIRCAKRTGFIEPSEQFFEYYRLIERIRENLCSLAEDIFTNSADAQRGHLIIFGELFGGGYPGFGHDCPIQQGIWYSPQIEFSIFDICHMISGEMHYLPYSTALTLADRHHLLVMKPLFIGSYREACQYNICFQSTIPGLLSLPLENLSSNLAEGIVIREFDSASPCHQTRPIIKMKSVEFSEGEGCPPGDLTDIHLKGWIHSLLNWNRLAAASSKVGSYHIVSNRNQIVHLALEDIREETGLSESEFQPYVDELKYLAHNTLASLQS
jgi:Rnl2 family RNA ligase